MHLLLIRHARSTANVENVLAGRREGVHLDEVGRQQAERLLDRLSGVPVTAVVGSPLTRCRETAELICIDRRLAYQVDERLNEVDYGLWSGKRLEELNQEPMWSDIQNRPSAVQFPNGESFLSVFSRASDFLESMKQFDDDQIVAAFTHGDIVKALLSIALVAPGDEFQRIVADPASISLLRITSEKVFVLRTNDAATSVKDVLVKENHGVVGGGR